MTATPLPSNRSFGAVFIVFFSLVAAVAWWRDASWSGWPAGMALVTLAMTRVAPRLLAPFNRAWMKLAEVMHRVMSPLVLGLIFFGMFTPIAWGMRLAGRDALKRRFERAAPTYWNERDPPGPDPAGLPDQF
jgi:hypothetical protein